MIKWETIVSSADEKITLLQWLKMVEKAINDGALTGISVQQADAEHATITFNFEGDPAQAFTITLPAGPPGAQGVPGTDGAAGADGTDGRDALVQNRALSSANITSPMAIPIEALNRTAVVGEPIVMFATDTTENKTYMLIGTVTKVGIPDVNPYTFVTFSSKVDITGMVGPAGPPGEAGQGLVKRYMHNISYIPQDIQEEPIFKFTIFSTYENAISSLDELIEFFSENGYLEKEYSCLANGSYESEGIVYNVWGIYYNSIDTGLFYVQYGNNKDGFELGSISDLRDVVIDLGTD